MDSRPLLAVIVIVAGLCIVGFYAGDTYSYFNANQASGTNAADAWTSETWSESTTDEFNAGVPVNVDTSGDQVKLALSPPPAYVYALRGGGSRAFWRYDISANTWSGMSSTPDSIEDGGALVYTGGNYIYALRGGLTRDFYRYSISGNTWTSMADTPWTLLGGPGPGASLAFDGTYIYALRGGLYGSRDFWRYNIASNEWSDEMAPIPKIANAGAALTCGGEYVYATRGGTDKDFYRYDTGTGDWTSMEGIDSGYRPGSGGALSNNGTHIFMLVGGNSNRFGIYRIAAPRYPWSYYTIPNDPNGFEVGSGGALASDSTAYVYALQGDGTSAFRRYTTATGTWASMAATPAGVEAGGSLVYVPAMGSACYSSPGSVASVVFNTTTANSRWDMLAWTASIPPGTGISMQVRASDTAFLKNAASPAWTPVTGSYVNGRYVVTYPLPSGRHQQWRATLSSSLCGATPILSDVTVYYTNWATYIGGMSGLMSLATGFSSRVSTGTSSAFAPVEIPSGVVDPNSLFIEPEPTELPALIAAGNTTNASETQMSMEALNATANVTQTAVTLIPVNATTVPVDTRAMNVTANLTPVANATETPVPTATTTLNATANVTTPATAIPAPDVTTVPIGTVATTEVPIATPTTMPTTTPPTATPTTVAPLTLPEVVSTDRNLTTFVNLTRQAGLDTLLSGPGPYTVFAPSDDAFRAMPPSYVEGLLADPASLTQMLNRHIVEDRLDSTELQSLSTIRTLGGTDVNVTTRYGIVKVGGGTVNYTETRAGNGVIHVIDAVIPPAETAVPRAAPSAATVAQTWTPLPTVTVPVVTTGAVTTEATILPQTTASVRTTPTRGKHYLT